MLRVRSADHLNLLADAQRNRQPVSVDSRLPCFRMLGKLTVSVNPPPFIPSIPPSDVLAVERIDRPEDGTTRSWRENRLITFSALLTVGPRRHTTPAAIS